MSLGLIEQIRQAETAAAGMRAKARADSDERLRALRDGQESERQKLETAFRENRNTVPQRAREQVQPLLAEKQRIQSHRLAAIRESAERHGEDAAGLILSILLE